MPSKDRIKKAKEVYRKINSGEPIEPRLTSIKSRRYMTLVTLLGLITWALLTLPLTSAFFVFLFFIVMLFINVKELYSTPLALDKLQRKFDRPSRLIYEGDEPIDVANFHIGLLEALIKTLLGRTSDATNQLTQVSGAKKEKA